MSDYTFSSVPSVSISRTKFHRTMTHNLSFNLGEIVVLNCDECIPGSTHKLDFGSLIRMSTPIAPIMDDIQFDMFPFFVPMRLCWDDWKRFMGENTTGAGALNKINSDVTIPTYKTQGSEINTIADDLGIPAYKSGNTAFDINVLPIRAVLLIYNRFFRNQNVEAPLPIGLGAATVGTGMELYAGLKNSTGSTPTGAIMARLKAYKLPDYFTSSLPYAQKGDPVSIFGANSLAPVGAQSAEHTFGVNQPIHYKLTGANVDASGALGVGSGGLNKLTNTTAASGSAVYPTNLYADLSNAVNATINDLRFAFQVQKFLEKDALYGSRYWEILHAHYNVTSPDATLQDPQLLGAYKYDINIQQVLQTTGFTDPTNTNLGTPGANSVTGKNGHLCTFSCTEHGYLITLGVARQKRHTYSQGLNRMFSRNSRFDFFFPVFANLGCQSVKQKEIDVQSSTPDNPFGYQEAWAEYRYLPSYNSGLLNPVRANALDYWTLADKYSSTPTLSASFLKESRDNLVRALVTGATGPDFIGSWYFRDTVVNPMPLYSIPGFADHH